MSGKEDVEVRLWVEQSAVDRGAVPQEEALGLVRVRPVVAWNLRHRQESFGPILDL